MTAQDVRFGIDPGHDMPVDEIVPYARRADALGFDVFTMSEHLQYAKPTCDPWTALTWVAAQTTRIRVGSNALCVPNRPPAVLAKMAATLDRLSGGRLALGLCVGKYDSEFESFGLAVRSDAAKMTALHEAVEIMQALWTTSGGPVSYAGEVFSVRDAVLDPRPARRVPLWIGTYGRRGLAITGRRADGWIASLAVLEFDAALEMLRRVQESARAAGRDPAALTYACNVVVSFDARATPTPQLVAGPDEAIADQLAAIIRAGFTLPIVILRQPDQCERLAAEIIPRVRAGLQ